MNEINHDSVYQKADALSGEFDYSLNEIAVILAAGHGKRIKSTKSKMLHSIWGIPTVERVYNSTKDEISQMNTIIVVGIKADDVMEVFGSKPHTKFAYQKEQKGTGHAVQVGIEKIDKDKFTGILYVLPGDLGLIDRKTMVDFRNDFVKSKADMMVLTGIYEGPLEQNSYGRIVRVKDVDEAGSPSGVDFGKVIEIMEHKDILALADDEIYRTEYNGKVYAFSRKELLVNREFNSGVYAFDFKKLIDLIYRITNNNAQGEIYITDLIGMFNKEGYAVKAVSPAEQYVVMGFNDKSVLKTMEKVYRNIVYDKIGKIIEFDDPDDFYIHESVVEDILSMDKKGIPLDIRLGKGVYIGEGVSLNYNVWLKKNVFVNGNVKFGSGVTVWENAHLSCFQGQEFVIGDGVEILWGDIIKGNIVIGEGSKIESSVNMTGSDESPLRIGRNVLIKGTSYIFGSVIEDDIHIEHSVIIRKRVIRLQRRDGSIQSVRFYLPMPTGADVIEDLREV